MAEMKMHEEMLHGLLKDVKAIVAQNEQLERDWSAAINEANGEHAASTARLADIKKEFSFASWFNAKRRNGITAEQAREEANRYRDYADTIDQIAKQEQRIEDAKATFNKVEEDLIYARSVEETTEHLVTLLGGLDRK